MHIAPSIFASLVLHMSLSNGLNAGAMAEWPAMQKWAQLEWWLARHGARLMPVELGRHGEEGWRERIVGMDDFIQQYMLLGALETPGVEVAYMAQHCLIDQLPSLQQDIQSPTICSNIEVVNAWMGTAGATSPCHFDSYDNLLAQVCGILVRSKVCK